MNVKRLHIPAIDTIRGVAASMVCFFHFVCTTRDYIYDQTISALFHFGQYGVHMFFVVSGVVIPLSMIIGSYQYRSWFRFISKRFVRIEPPYLVSILIAVSYLILRNFIPGTADTDLTPNLTTVLLHAGYLIPFLEGHHWINEVYWTLAIEFQYYLLLCAFFPLFTKKVIWYRLPLYLIFLGSGVFVSSDSFLPVWMPLFMIGIIHVLWRYNYVSKSEYLLVLALSIFASCQLTNITGTVFGVVTLVVIHWLPNLRNGVTKFLGEISYSLYLLHAIIGGAVVNYLSHTFSVPWQKPLVILGGYAISIVAAYVSYQLVERPSRRWSAGIKYR